MVLNNQMVGGSTVYCVRCIHHMIPLLQAGIVHLSFQTTVGDIEWSDSRRVDYVLLYIIILQAGIVYHSNPKWMILNVRK